MTDREHRVQAPVLLRSRATLAVCALLAVTATMTSVASATPSPHAPFVVAAGGDLDPTFGENGMVITDVGPDGDSANAIAIQADGKIVVAGEVAYGAAFGVARYTSDGALDLTFGDAGIVTTDISPSGGAYAMAIQTEGKIVVVGGGRRFALVRYMPDGSLDPTFEGDGIVTTNFTPKADVADAVTIQADGKIVAAGVSGVVGTNLHFDDTKVALARYDADGSLDTSFGGDGRVTTNLSGTDDRALAVATQSDGTIVIAGSAGAYTAFALVRYNPDGTRDPSFGIRGRVTTNFRGDGEFATSVAIQADGKIVAAGEPGNDTAFALARYDIDGTLDPTFGEDGKLTTDFLTRHDLAHTGGWARGVAIQTDGKIVAVGASAVGSGGDTEFALARYEPDGTLDAAFGGDGLVTTEWTMHDNDSAFAVAIQADGKIVAAGTAAHFGADATFALARYVSRMTTGWVDRDRHVGE